MSHVSECDMVIPAGRLPLFEAVLATMCPELEFMGCQSSYRTWKTDHGHLVGDWPVPAGLTEATVGKCAHAVRVRPECSCLGNNPYEIGLVPMSFDRDEHGKLIVDPKTGQPMRHYDANSQEFVPITDFYNQGNGILRAKGMGESKHIKKDGADKVIWGGLLKQAYQMALDKQIAAEQGDDITFKVVNGVPMSVKTTACRLGVA